MKLNVVIGFKEFVQAGSLSSETILSLAKELDANCIVPCIGWATGESLQLDHSHFFEKSESVKESAGLLLNYLTDLYGPNDHLTIFLPFESCLGKQSDAEQVTLTDSRCCQFLEQAKESLGPDSVTTTAIVLSRNAQAVLERLAAEVREKTTETTTEVARFVVRTWSAENAAGPGSFREDLQLSYSRAVVELGERIVGQTGLFSSSLRAAFVAQNLEENRLLIRPELSPEFILESLGEGGELYELISKPLARHARPRACRHTSSE